MPATACRSHASTLSAPLANRYTADAANGAKNHATAPAAAHETRMAAPSDAQIEKTDTAEVVTRGAGPENLRRIADYQLSNVAQLL